MYNQLLTLMAEALIFENIKNHPQQDLRFWYDLIFDITVADKELLLCAIHKKAMFLLHELVEKKDV